LFADGLIDVAQFHGDETPGYCAAMTAVGLPFIKALPALPAALADAHHFGAQAILIDTPAPGTYGGTGEAFDWSIAAEFIRSHPQIPVILAGGITAGNAAQAVAAVRPAAIDVASGAESSPGHKDLLKVCQIRDSLGAKR
jgi:phosphoribosylanthranilate isomerase